MNPDDTLWTELSLRMREGPDDAEVHIDPSSFEPLVLQIRSPNAGLAEKVAEYLLVSCGGRITHELPR